jgi:hypothetical protein
MTTQEGQVVGSEVGEFDLKEPLGPFLNRLFAQAVQLGANRIELELPCETESGERVVVHATFTMSTPGERTLQ